MDPSTMAFDPSTLRALGWRHTHTHGSCDVAAARKALQQRNGIAGLETVSPTQPGYAARAADLFHRDGYVVVTDVLTPAAVATIRAGCARVVNAMAGPTGDQRRRYRWSFGAGRRPWGLVEPEWAVLVDPPALMSVLTAIYGADDFLCCGCGGDFVLPGAVEYQNLHSDMGTGEDTKLELDASDTGTLLPGGFWEPDDGSSNGKRVPLAASQLPGKRYIHGAGAPHSTFHDPSSRLDIRDLPPTFIAVNFPLELGENPAIGHTHTNGATRQIPGTQNSKLPIPPVGEEPDWMRYSTVSPAPAGCAVVRDIRAWHGGTPNLSNNVRAIPQSQFVPAWYRVRFTRTLSYELYTSLSAQGQQICREIVASPHGPPVQTASYFHFPPEKLNEAHHPDQGQGWNLIVPKL